LTALRARWRSFRSRTGGTSIPRGRVNDAPDPDDLRDPLAGVLAIVTQGETVLRDLNGMLPALESGTFTPVEWHKLKIDLAGALKDLTVGRAALADVAYPPDDTARAAAVAHLAAVRFSPPDRHDESLANATVRQDLLTIVGQMRQDIERGRKGLSLFSTLVGSWMQGGQRPTRAMLGATRDSLELGLKGMDALDALALAFEQRVRWFDASRSTPTEGPQQ
jgi:hypothetical protein